MEPQNPGTNTNTNPMTPPWPDPAVPAATSGATPPAQPAPPTPPSTAPGVTPQPTAPQPASPNPLPTQGPTPAETPNVAPAPAPEFPAQPPQPQQPVVPAAGAYPAMSASDQAAGRAKKFKLIGISIIAAAVLLLAVGGYFVYSAMSGLKLKEHKGDGYSVLVPASYKQKTDGDTIVFEEDDEEDTRSSVHLIGETFPNALTQEEIDSVTELFKEAMKAGANEFTDDGEIENLNITDTTHKGRKAVKITADAVKDDKSTGKATMIFIFTEKGYYGLNVLVHSEDTDLDKKTSAIIESFEVE